MHITCSKDDLMTNINIVSKAVSVKSTLPILECILLSVDDNGFRMTSNDLELAIQTSYIKSDVTKTGSIALESRMFSEIIKKLPDQEVIIYTDEANMTFIKSGKAEFRILGQNSNEFPSLPAVEKNDEYTLSSNEFRNMIKQTIFSISATESKPTLTGELIEIENGSLNVVAVDSFRVSFRVAHIATEKPNRSVIVPGKSLNELSKILPTIDDSELSLYFTEKHILFETDNCIVISRLLEGEFLKYKQIFTDDYTTIIYANKQEILASLERSSLISKDSNKIPIKLKIEDDTLIITSNSETGRSYEEMPIEMDGNMLEVAFNPKYLIDAIKVIDTEKISIQFTTPLSPCIIKGHKSDLYKYLILPLRLNVGENNE